MADFAPPDMGGVPLPILHREATFVVVNKPARLLSVPGRGPRAQDCVVGRLRALLPDATGSMAVHRLDMDTSGLLLMATTPEAHRELSRQFEARRVSKRYVALLAGVPDGRRGTVSLRFRLDPADRPRQIYDPVHGKLGETGWEVLSTSAGTTRVRFSPRTGRTHQLRLHAAHPRGLACPILGDRLYGDPGSAERLMLHAESLAFHHPETGAPMEIVCPAPF